MNSSRTHDAGPSRSNLNPSLKSRAFCAIQGTPATSVLRSAGVSGGLTMSRSGTPRLCFVMCGSHRVDHPTPTLAQGPSSGSGSVRRAWAGERVTPKHDVGAKPTPRSHRRRTSRPPPNRVRTAGRQGRQARLTAPARASRPKGARRRESRRRCPPP
jgi:hypothetical protein